MSDPSPYRRVDTSHLPMPFGTGLGRGPDAGDGREGLYEAPSPHEAEYAPANARGRSAPADLSVRWTVLLISTVLCVVQMVVSITALNLRGVLITSTLISMMAFATLLVAVLVVNPVLRAIFREKVLRPLNRAELTCIFAALLVTAGIGTFGLASPLVPLVAAPWNPEWNTPQRGWEEQVLPYLNESLYISATEQMTAEEQAAALQTIRQFREGLRPIGADGLPMTMPPEDASWREKLPYWRALFEQIPWWTWVKPLSLWLIFIGACYAMFYCMAYVVLRSWVYREQLIFPLAQLSEQLLPEAGSRRWLPPPLRSGGFWTAFAVVVGILSFNAGVNAQFIPGLSRIGLGLDASTVRPLLQDTILEGMTGGRFQLQFLIIFMALGLAFLLPTAISFSLWFYFLIANLTLVVMVWLGHGQTGANFPSDLYHQSNILTAQGGGALLMFGGICLGRALAEWLRLGRDKTWPQRLRMSGPVIGLAAAIAVIAGWLIWNDLPVMWALCVTMILVLFTMGVMRVVAESGVYWFQMQTGPFHLYSALGLSTFLKAPAIVPLMPIYAVLFVDVKTFLAPNIANAGKMHLDAGGSRRKFHLNVILCIVVSVIVAIGLSVYLAHLIGAQQMNTWFYSTLPQDLMNRARDLTVAPPDLQTDNALAYAFGSGWVALTLFLRQFLFWFPHPIGYVMFVSPLMRNLWFSFLLGWIAKKLVITYGGKQTFEYARPIFIGLIVAEALAILGWTLAGLWFDFSPGLTDNRGSA